MTIFKPSPGHDSDLVLTRSWPDSDLQQGIQVWIGSKSGPGWGVRRGSGPVVGWPCSSSESLEHGKCWWELLTAPNKGYFSRFREFLLNLFEIKPFGESSFCRRAALTKHTPKHPKFTSDLQLFSRVSGSFPHALGVGIPLDPLKEEGHNTLQNNAEKFPVLLLSSCQFSPHESAEIYHWFEHCYVINLRTLSLPCDQRLLHLKFWKQLLM